MKHIVIAAGYATRLYPLTENFPKPLLRVGKDTILGRMVSDVDGIEEVTGHIVVVNHKFVDHFREWRDGLVGRKPVEIVDDGTTTNEGRLGAVRDLLLGMERMEEEEDILVTAADNILEFSMRGFVDFFKEKGTSVIMCHEEPELRRLQRTGVIAVDESWRVEEMQEKPEKPVSHWAVPPFYIYSRKDLGLIRGAVDDGCGTDAPGNLAHYVVDHSVVHAWRMPARRFDIGSLDSYEEAKKIYG